MCLLVYNSCLWCVEILPLKKLCPGYREANEMQMRAASNSVSGNKVIVSGAVEAGRPQTDITRFP